MTSPWAEAVLLDVLAEFRGGARSDFPRRPSTARQVFGVIEGLDDAQRYAGLLSVAGQLLAGVDGESALFAGLADGLGAPWGSRATALEEQMRRRAAAEGAAWTA